MPQLEKIKVETCIVIFIKLVKAKLTNLARVMRKETIMMIYIFNK